MKTRHLFAVVTAALLAIGATASETIVKNSAPFSFPLTIGAVAGQRVFSGQVRFGALYRGMAGKSLDLSWSLPKARSTGTIVLYSLNGSVIRTLPITAASGSIRWNIAELGLAKGIYFARLSSATVKKNHKIVIY